MNKLFVYLILSVVSTASAARSNPYNVNFPSSPDFSSLAQMHQQGSQQIVDGLKGFASAVSSMHTQAQVRKAAEAAEARERMYAEQAESASMYYAAQADEIVRVRERIYEQQEEARKNQYAEINGGTIQNIRDQGGSVEQDGRYFHVTLSNGSKLFCLEHISDGSCSDVTP